MKVLDYSTLLKRYPKLIERLMVACNLSGNESACCLQAHMVARHAPEILGPGYAGEAVDCAGGVIVCIRRAIRVRGLARRAVVRAMFAGKDGA